MWLDCIRAFLIMGITQSCFRKKIKKAILMRGVQAIWGRGQILDFLLYLGSNLRNLTLGINI